MSSRLHCGKCGAVVHSTLTDQCPVCGAENYGQPRTSERLASLEAELTRLRSEISSVRGHLEGHADSIEAFGVNGNEGEEKLWRALREDADRLGKLGEER